MIENNMKLSPEQQAIRNNSLARCITAEFSCRRAAVAELGRYALIELNSPV
jgi:hypothetical protein